MTDDLSQAATEWLRLYNSGQISNDETFKNFVGVLELERTFDDGSILRWSEVNSGWRFYKDSDAKDDLCRYGRE